MLTPREIANQAPFTGNDNFIINPIMQIQQYPDDIDSVAAALVSNELYIDRWKTYILDVTGTLQRFETNQPDGKATKSLRASATSSGTGRIGQFQYIEDFARFAGKKISISAKVKSNSSQCRLLFNDTTWVDIDVTHSGNSTWETLSATFTVDPACVQGIFGVYLRGVDGDSVPITSGDYLEFTEVKVELAPQPTPFYPRTNGEELALCQRYYWSETAAGGGAGYRYGTTSSGLYLAAEVIFPVQMRVIPTIAIVTDPTYLQCTHGDLPASTSGFVHRVAPTIAGHYRAYNGVYSADAEI